MQNVTFLKIPNTKTNGHSFSYNKITKYEIRLEYKSTKAMIVFFFFSYYTYINTYRVIYIYLNRELNIFNY